MKIWGEIEPFEYFVQQGQIVRRCLHKHSLSDLVRPLQIFIVIGEHRRDGEGKKPGERGYFLD